jgi:hypothetical protein
MDRESFLLRRIGASSPGLSAQEKPRALGEIHLHNMQSAQLPTRCDNSGTNF